MGINIGNSPFNMAMLGLGSGINYHLPQGQANTPSADCFESSFQQRSPQPAQFGFWGKTFDDMARVIMPNHETDVLLSPPQDQFSGNYFALNQAPMESDQLYSDGSQERAREGVKDLDQMLVVSNSTDTRTSHSGNYKGWASSGFSVNFPDEKRLRGLGHLASVTVVRRDGKKLPFKIIDQYVMGENGRDIFKRKMVCEEMPHGFTQVGETSFKTLSEIDPNSVFVEAHLNRFAVLSFVCFDPTSEYYGLELALIFGLVDIVGGSRGYVHKQIVGIQVAGTNPLIGNSWEAEFNKKLPRITKDADSMGQYTLTHEGDSLNFTWPMDENGHPQEIDFIKKLPAGYEIIPDPLERIIGDHPRVVILRTPIGEPLVIMNDNGDVKLEGRAHLLKKVGVDWEVPLAQTNHHLLVSDKKGPLYVRQRVGKKVKKIAKKKDQVHTFANHTCVVHPLENPPVSVTRLDTGELLVLDLDEATFFAFLSLRAGWSRDNATNALSDNLFQRTHLETITKSVMTSPVYYTAKGAQRGRVQIVDEELGLEIFVTDMGMTSHGHLPVDLHYAHVVVREIGSQEYLELPLKIDPDSGRIALMRLATYTILDMVSRDDGRPSLVIEADYQGDLDGAWDQIITKSSRKPYESLINGLPLLTQAFPSERSRAISQMHKLVSDASEGVVRETIVSFLSLAVENFHQDSTRKEKRYTVWDVSLPLTVVDGRLLPVTEDDGVTITVPNLLYRQVMNVYGRPVIANHSFSDLPGRLIRTETNSFGWAIEVSLCNENGMAHTVFLQPINTELEGHEKLVGQTPVFGLQISTELVPISDGSKQLFLKRMPKEGGFKEKPIKLTGIGETTEQKDATTSVTVEEALERLIGHSVQDVTKAPFEPGQEAYLDSQAALSMPLKACQLSDGVPVTLSLGDHRVTGLEIRMWTNKKGFWARVSTQEAIIEMADGTKRRAVVFNKRGYMGQHYLIDVESGLAYPLYLTPTQLFLSTTPGSIEEPIDPKLIERWIKIHWDHYHRNTRFYSLQNMPRENRIRFSRNPVRIGEELVWQDIYFHDGDVYTGALGFKIFRDSQGKVSLPREGGQARFLPPGESEFIPLDVVTAMMPTAGRSRGIMLIKFMYYEKDQEALFLGTVFALRNGLIIPISSTDKRYFKPNGTLNMNGLVKRFESIAAGREMFDIIPMDMSGLTAGKVVMEQDEVALGLPSKTIVKQKWQENAHIGTRAVLNPGSVHDVTLEQGDFKLSLPLYFDVGRRGHIKLKEQIDTYVFKLKLGVYEAQTKNGPRQVRVENIPGDYRQYWLIDEETGERYPLFVERSSILLFAVPHVETAMIPGISTFDFSLRVNDDTWRRALMWANSSDRTPLEPDHERKRYDYRPVPRSQIDLSPSSEGYSRKRTAMLYEDGSAIIFDHAEINRREHQFERMGYMAPGDDAITWGDPLVIDYTDLGVGYQAAIIGARDPTHASNQAYDGNLGMYTGTIFILHEGDIHPITVYDYGMRTISEGLKKSAIRHLFMTHGLSRRDWLVGLPAALKGIVDEED
ncbi:hypothetical protein KJ708_13620 [bacterium]|nr:hypothetical protein [bacterium]MBU1916491.1 hypothetical protein [bacterium]